MLIALGSRCSARSSAANLKDLWRTGRTLFARAIQGAEVPSKTRPPRDDFLSEAGFDEICEANGIAMEGPGGRDSLLDIFDKLGIVMHFAKLPYLKDYVLNPRWLTYGVYTIMYSDEAQAAKGRLGEAQSRRYSRKGESLHPEWPRLLLSAGPLPHHRRRHDRFRRRLPARNGWACDPGASCARAARA